MTGSEVAQLFFGHQLESLSDELVAELVAKGWPESDLREMAARGGRFSRSRNSIIFGPEWDWVR